MHYYSMKTSISHCNIISNKCLASIIYASSISADITYITYSIITKNEAENLFYVYNCQIKGTFCLIEPNYIQSKSRRFGSGSVDITETYSLEIVNSHISTFLCYPFIPLFNLKNITTNQTTYKLGIDSNITGTISFDRIKEEPFTLIIWIDNLNSIKQSNI